MRITARNILTLGAAAVLLLAVAVSARTITLTDESSERAASIWEGSPQASWVGYEAAAGNHATTMVDIRRDSGFLLQIPIDKIPEGNRITKAELLIPLNYTYAADAKLHVWRVIPDWGPGVCWENCTIRPKVVPWAMPGARGSSADRATKPTAIVTLRNGSTTELIANVTEDVEMWYSGSAKNNGWLFTLEEDTVARFLPPCYSYRGSWKLRITYEPQ